MKFKHIFLLLTLVFATIQTVVFAQQDSLKLKEILTKTKRLSDEQPLEKVYLHFDKPYYAVADTMWFKGYITSEQHVPSPLSKILYVELLNGKDSLVQSLKIPVKNGIAYGNIPLNPSNFKQGNFYVRAYTLWMLNFDSSYFFTKNITIGEAIDKQLITNVVYNNQEVNRDIKTTARIQFKDLNKKPYANKVVNWQVYSNYDIYTRGKATTDASGFINIMINSKNGELIKNGTIITDINLSEKETASKSFELKQQFNNIDFQFFPEGGQFIAGIANQMGFKAVKADGFGIDAKGVIVDEQNNEVIQFTSSFAGMGSFLISPETGKSYKAKVTFKDGAVKTYDLPKPVETGITLQNLPNNTEFINIRILANPAFFETNKDKSFFIVGQNSNVVYYAAQASLKASTLTVKIPKVDFPSGIAQITLFNSENKPISERLVFVYNDAINLTVKSDLPIYKPRQKVKLNIAAKQGTNAITGDFSVAVVDEQKVPFDENSETTILSNILLTSDLKGYIEKPNYYFNQPDEKKWSDLDKLLLTQGYRRFSYAEIMAGKYPQLAFLPEQGINISGTLRDLTGMPIKKGAMRLMVTGKPISAETTTSNMGVFSFQNLNIPDSSQVVVSAKYNANANNLMIMMDGTPVAGKPFNPNFASQVANIDTTLSSYLANSAKQYRYLRTLKTVEVVSKAKKTSSADFPALSGLGQMADHQIDGSYFNGCNIFLECIKVRATGLTYDINDQKFYVSRDYNQGNRTPAQVFMNGMPIDARELMNVNAADVDNVEIFLKDQLGTVNRLYNSNGVLSIYTKKKPVGQKISKQALLDMLPKNNIVNFSPQGYSKEREFYSPKYLPGKTYTNSDLRTTVYWNPKVFTDEKGNTSLEFYNADGRGTYKVVVEGIDKDGNLGRAVYRYNVK